MSIGSFDEENFLSEAFPETANNSQTPLNSSDDMSTSSVDIRSLLSEPFKEPEPRTRLVFADIETPKNNGRGQLKRKNISRRCLSTDLNNSSLNFEVLFCSFLHLLKFTLVYLFRMMTRHLKVIANLKSLKIVALSDL